MKKLLPVCLILMCVSALDAQRLPTPVRQSALTTETATHQPLTLRDASRNDRWLGLGASDLRWAPDGSVVYFRWNRNPDPSDMPAADPWFKTERDGRWVEQVTDEEERWVIPGTNIVWSADGQRAAWSSGSSVFVFSDGESRAVMTLGDSILSVRFAGNDAVDFESGQRLFRYDLTYGSMALLAQAVTVQTDRHTEAAEWLAQQQRDLFAFVRENDARTNTASSLRRARSTVQPIPVQSGQRLENLQVSPDGQFVTFRMRERAANRPRTQYVDYTDASGYSVVRNARPKTGELRDVTRLGLVRIDAGVVVDSVQITWVDLPESGDDGTVPHGPFWSPHGTRSVVQFIGEDHQDVWFAEVNLDMGTTEVITHDHDDGWIGGPPVQANYLQPALMEWLPDGSWVFASERTGWSHLYRVDTDGNITALTSGDWEVRAARLSRDRSFWLVQTSETHPSDDQLYRMPATGGDMTALTSGYGRNEGWPSPDGQRMAVLRSHTTQLPDVYVSRVRSDDLRQVTQSGSDNFYTTALVEPAIVSFPHPDGDLIWAALYEPAAPHPDRPAVIHVHGGGYRQFAHRGWSVYGWALHVGYVTYLVEQGYTVLDFDYRGGAGFGRDYRTDIARSMGIKDADGVAAAARYLTGEHGIDATRIGMHGVSYGGFLTLMTLFRHPGVVSAGIARASVTDWAHYSDGWTSRILGVPYDDPDAYERSSPIYYADGLQDHLLITHGILDDNVHFQDAARLVQKLIELEKDFEVMYYPIEPHTIETEASRYDFVRRATQFFDTHLIRR